MVNIMQRARLGLPLSDLGIIDAHGHIGGLPSVHAAYGEAHEMLLSMNQIGIQKTCLSSLLAIGADYRLGNDQVAEAIRLYPDRFAGYAVINPNYPNEIEGEVSRCLDTLGFFAVKIHPTTNEYPPDGPAYQRLYAILQERCGILLSHTFDDAATFDRIAAAYPDVTFIYAHIGGGYDGRRPFPWADVLRDRPNAYADTVLSVVPFGGLEKLVEQVGADKLVMGTDVPFNDNAHQIARVTHADLSDEDKLKLLKLNMQRIMDRKG
jgi:hypothetical protein